MDLSIVNPTYQHSGKMPLMAGITKHTARVDSHLRKEELFALLFNK